MNSPLEWRKAAAKEIARSAGQLDRLKACRHDLTLCQARIRDLASERPSSSSLPWAVGDLQCALAHLDHAISALEAMTR